MSLAYISQQITIYFGLCLLFTGVIGNSINVLVFSTVRTYRTNPCSFYFLVVSIDNIAFLSMNLISRIVITGYGFDLTKTSLVWCKARNYFLGALSLISFTLACLPAIDQFLVTSRSAYLRSLSNIKWAHRIVLIIIIVWLLHGIPVLFFVDIISPTNICVNTNSGYTIYISIYVLCYTCIFPAVTMIIFGYLTYRNIHQTRVLAEQHADRQLTRMTLFQVIFVVVSITPYGINQIYGLVTSGMIKDADRVLKETFASTIFALLVYVYYVGSCYIFLISSSRFRRTIKDRILFWRRHNRINPFQQPTLTRATIRNKVTAKIGTNTEVKIS